MPAKPRKANSQRESGDLLPTVLLERGQLQRGSGGASVDTKRIRERGHGTVSIVAETQRRAETQPYPPIHPRQNS